MLFVQVHSSLLPLVNLFLQRNNQRLHQRTTNQQTAYTLRFLRMKATGSILFSRIQIITAVTVLCNFSQMAHDMHFCRQQRNMQLSFCFIGSFMAGYAYAQDKPRSCGWICTKFSGLIDFWRRTTRLDFVHLHLGQTACNRSIFDRHLWPYNLT